MPKKKLPESPEDPQTLNIMRIYNTVPVSIAIYNDIDKTVKLNQKFTATFGYTDDDIKTVNDWWNLSIRDPIRREILKTEWNKRFKAFMKEKKPFEPMEFTADCKNGSVKYVIYTPKIIESFYIGSFEDITQWKLSEQKLNASERRARGLLNAPNLPILLLDKNSVILEMNDASFRKLNINPDALIGTRAIDLFSKFGLDRPYKIEEVLESKQNIRFTYSFLNTIYEIDYYPLIDENGEVEKIALFARDISGEKKLRDSETKFRTFMEHGPFRAYIKNKEGKYIYGNPATLEFIKSSSEKNFIGSTVSDFFDKDTAKEMTLYDNRVLQDQISIIIEPHPRKDSNGKATWMKEIKFPIPISEEESMIGGLVMDITDEIQLREQLEESEKKARILLNAPTDPIVLFDRSGTILDLNSSCAERINMTQQEAIGQNILSLSPLGFNTNEIFERTSLLSTLIKNKKPMEFMRDYLNMTMQFQLFPIFDLAGEVDLIALFIHDITKLKENEKKLQLAQFSMDNSSIPILTINAAGDIIYANKIAIKTLGYSKEKMLKLKAWDLSGDTSPIDFPFRIKQMTQLEKNSGETRIKKADGTTFPAYVTLNYLKLHEEAIYTVYLQDMTLQKKNELELNKLFNATEQSPISIVITDPDGNIEYVNPKFCILTGYSQEELLGKNPRILKTGYTTKQEYAQLWNTIKNGEVWQGIFRNVKKNGDFFWENATISPIFGPNGEIQNFLGVKEDITEKMTLQEQLQHSQKMEAMGRLAGGIAHDFNNILTVIMGTAQLLHHEMLDDSTQDSLSEIIKASNRAATLTRQLLAFSKKQVLKPKLVDLNRVLVEMESMLRRILPENIQLILQVHSQPITIKVDLVQLEQVILNLVINAKEAMVKGGKLEISTYVISKHIGNQLKYYGSLSIIDTGIGMDEKTKMRLFEPFFTTKEKGTGLGLATVYGIIAQSNGDIEVDSDIGKGSKFVINFPLKLNAVGEEEEIIMKKSEWRGTETILVIEDEEGVRKILSQILNNEGYTVWEAENGESALLNYSHLVNKIDLIVSDVIMPVMGGVETLSKFQELKPEIKSIFLSGYVGDEFLMDEKEVFITKPINRIDLLKKIRDILD